MREIVEKVAKYLDKNFEDVVTITEGRVGRLAVLVKFEKLFKDTVGDQKFQ